jgi:hypothetical protein
MIDILKETKKRLFRNDFELQNLNNRLSFRIRIQTYNPSQR